MTQFSSEVFKAFLSLYWLRPENGALAYYQSQSWQDVKVSGPSIDISTGDGFSIFLHCGGRFHESFDFFCNNTAARRFSHDKFIDIYDRIDQTTSYHSFYRRNGLKKKPSGKSAETKIF